MFKRINISIIFPLLIILSYFFSVNQLFNNTSLTPYDDTVIIEPLYKVSSFSNYFHLKSKNLIWDVQPIRDISYLIDIKISKNLNWWSFQKTNFILWFLICIFFYCFCKKLTFIFAMEKDANVTNWIIFFSVLFLINPVNQLEPFWLSSRKHLLSTLFITISAIYLLDSFDQHILKLKKALLCCFFYLLSIFSHPITIFFPLFVIIYLGHGCELKHLISKKLFIFILLLALILFIGLYLNYVFYHVEYPQMTTAKSYKFTTENMLQVRLLTLGRFFYQIFDFTQASPFEHDRGSIRNIIGLLSLPIFIFICLKIVPKKLLFLGLTWFSFPLMLVILGDVKLFALDTYLTTASMGIIVLLIFLLSKIKFHFLFYLISIPMLFETHKYSIAFLNNLSLSLYAHNKETTVFSQYSLTNALLNQKRYNEAFAETYVLSKLTKNYRDLEILLPLTLYSTTNISNNMKLKLYEKWKHNGFYGPFFYSLIVPRNSSKFHQLQELAISKAIPAMDFSDFKDVFIKAVAFYYANCPADRKNSCRLKIENIKNSSPENFWSETDFIHYVLNQSKKEPSKTWITKSYFEKLEEVLVPSSSKKEKIISSQH